MVAFEVWVALATIGAYLVAVLAIGYQGWRVSTVGIEDWMTADRGLGIVVLTFTYAATYHSAFAFVGVGGFIYGNGIGIYVPAFAWIVMSGLILWIVGSRLWLLGEKHGYITPSDVFEGFYDSEVLAKLVSVALIMFTFPYIAIQMMGVGIIFDIATQGVVSFEIGAAILLVVGVVYVWLGGLRSVAWTDTLQGVFMFFGIWIAGILFLFGSYGGNIGAFWTDVVTEFGAYVTLPGPAGLFTSAWFGTWWIVLGIGLMMLPHIFLRYFAADSPRVLKWVSATGTAYLLVFYLPVVFLALGALVLLPELANPDSAIPAALYEFTPAWFASIVVSGAIAAAMSTADSQLHAIATLITRDFYEDYVAGGEINDRKETRFAKLLVPVLGVISYLIAIMQIDVIVQISNVAFSGAAQVFPLLIGALWWKRASTEGAIAGFVLGEGVTVALTFGLVSLPAAFPGFMAGFYGLIVTTVVFVAVSLATDAVPEENIDRIQGYIAHAINREWETGASDAD